MSTIKPLFMISFEGMNYELLTKWANENRLKNFKRFMKKGYMNRIKCSFVPYEASGLVSVFSGLPEYVHGVYSYWHANNPDYQPTIYSSKEIQDKMIWNKKEFKDKKFCLVNLFGTHPINEMNGYMLTYAMERTLNYIYPKTLRRELKDKGIYYIQDMYAFYNKQEKEVFLKEVKHVEEARHKTCQVLREKEIDVLIANYTIIDRVCHFYMHELLDNTMALEEKAVYQAYSYSDQILGEYMDYAEEHDCDLLLFSSVGFGHLKQFVEINQYLAEKGYLVYESDMRTPDWKSTIAFESVQGTHGININKAGFYEHGIVKGSEYEKVRDEVIEVLKEMKNPYTKEPMFLNVYPKEAIYHQSQTAPDIILEPYNWEYVPYGDALRADQVGRHNQSGWHRNESVWGYMGNGILHDEFEHVHSLTDLGKILNTFLSEVG